MTAGNLICLWEREASHCHYFPLSPVCAVTKNPAPRPITWAAVCQALFDHLIVGPGRPDSNLIWGEENGASLPSPASIYNLSKISLWTVQVSQSRGCCARTDGWTDGRTYLHCWHHSNAPRPSAEQCSRPALSWTCQSARRMASPKSMWYCRHNYTQVAHMYNWCKQEQTCSAQKRKA